MRGAAIPLAGEALELARCTLQTDHLRFFTSNHSSPSATTINTTMMLHGVDEVGSSLGGDAGFSSRAFFGAGGCTTGREDMDLDAA